MKRGALLVVVLTACHSPGPYGYSVEYATTSEEDAAVASAREYDPVMFSREPEKWRAGTTTFFGIVTSRAPGPGGAAYLTLSVRRLATRNLCSKKTDEDTCRVTVTDREFGVAHALVRLRPEDDMGEKSVGAGSLVRVAGTFGEDVDPGDAGPVLRASFYRHWPRYFYVTTSSADLMRQ